MKRRTRFPFILIASLLLISNLQGIAAENATQDSVANGGLRLNFRGAPLDSVLDYLSKAAGFIIVREAEVIGNVDVWSHQPLNKDEAVDLLNTILNEKGFAAIRNGRTLTIVSRDDAKQRDLPVRKGNEPEDIPKNDEMVHQIIPVRYVDAMQLIQDLTPLIPAYATLTANESSNALILTDTQANVRRIAEIIKALDTSISSISTVKVFQLRFADATELAQVVNQIFQTADTNSRSSRQNVFQRMMESRMGGRGGPGSRGGGDRGGSSGSQTDSVARQAASRVVAVADQNTNSLVVSAPEELMATIDTLITQIDTFAEDITEIRVFHLENADAEETAELVNDLFDDTQSSQQQGFSRFSRMIGGPGGGRGGPGGGRPGGSQGQESERKMSEETVVAVADPRTDSVVVTAASETMNQIAQMIAQLDSNKSKTQQVYIYTLKNAEPEYVAEILRNMFELQSSGTSGNRRTTTTGNTSNRTTTGNTGGRGNTAGNTSGFSSR